MITTLYIWIKSIHELEHSYSHYFIIIIIIIIIININIILIINLGPNKMWVCYMTALWYDFACMYFHNALYDRLVYTHQLLQQP